MDEILTNGLAELGLAAPDAALRRFLLYYDALTAKNAVMNLTAISGEAETARGHFLDCAAVLKASDFSGKTVVDVGTGAGFPGLVLKILEPSIRLTLLDSQKKRVDFLSETCALLGLEDVICIHGRAEEFASQSGPGREAFDIAVSRAVARLNVLCELCLPMVRPGGAFLAMKGPDAPQETEEAQNAVSILGARFGRTFQYTVPQTELEHCVVIAEKLSPTPAKYPRRFAKIQKQPL